MIGVSSYAQFTKNGKRLPAIHLRGGPDTHDPPSGSYTMDVTLRVEGGERVWMFGCENFARMEASPDGIAWVNVSAGGSGLFVAGNAGDTITFHYRVYFLPRSNPENNAGYVSPRTRAHGTSGV